MSRPVDPRLIRGVPSVRRYLVALSVLQGLAAVLVIVQACLLASSVVTVFVHHEYGGPLLTRLVLLGAAGIGRAGVSAAVEQIAARASVRVRADLRRRTLDAIVTLGPAWAQRQESGRLAGVAGPGLDGLDGYVARALPALVSAGLTPVVVLATITVADWQSGLLLVAMLPLVPLFMALVGVTTKRRVERQYLLLSRLAGQFMDLLRGLTTLRIYGQADRQEQTLRAASQRYRRETMAALRITFLSALVLDLVAALSVAVVAVDVGLRLDHGSLSFLTALVVLFLAPELFAPLRAMGAQFHANQEGATASGACLDLIEEAATTRAAQPAAAVAAAGTVVLDGVRVHYPDRHEAALDSVYLTVQPGEVAVIDGASGAGKSTILATLLGFVAPTSGSVLVGLEHDIVDLAGLDADSWRRNVAWVPQRPAPTQATVAAEVGLGDPGASDPELRAVCDECRTPDPQTRLGEDGRWVSAGQRRRIALARALLRARAVHRRGAVPLVLLDEPSEDLDADTEQVVAAVIVALQGWATVIVATHSPVLAAVAQRRITVAGGKVVANQLQRPRHRPVSSAPAGPLPPAAASITPAPQLHRLRLRDLAHEQGAVGKLVRAAALSAAAG
ncbi:thiol reductant ABC exporter subunit CydD, partial [Jatrophihabitans sp.]|uniref:thiol reductant ABC exporter subunit CydD n=1 Tax=Jatrophihabitans sp. TaxID=1932789 RepID=UPI0030C6F7BB|nr:transporter ATP-binding protein [Jatrophihabitans sp.]